MCDFGNLIKHTQHVDRLLPQKLRQPKMRKALTIPQNIEKKHFRSSQIKINKNYVTT